LRRPLASALLASRQRRCGMNTPYRIGRPGGERRISAAPLCASQAAGRLY